MNGKDNDNLKFDLNQFITLYNLDFCNEITIPQKVLNDKTGKYESIYKLHVIKKIIDLQRENNSIPCKFVILLTVKANFWQTEADNYENIMKVDPIVGDYFRRISHLRGLERSVRILRTYVFQTLSSILCTNCYIPEFLPVALYKGSGRNDLVQFTVVCTYEETIGRGAISRQNINDFLNKGFITPSSRNFQMEPSRIATLDEIRASLDPITELNSTVVYDQFWK